MVYKYISNYNIRTVNPIDHLETNLVNKKRSLQEQRYKNALVLNTSNSKNSKVIFLDPYQIEPTSDVLRIKGGQLNEDVCPTQESIKSDLEKLGTDLEVYSAFKPQDVFTETVDFFSHCVDVYDIVFNDRPIPTILEITNCLRTKMPDINKRDLDFTSKRLHNSIESIINYKNKIAASRVMNMEEKMSIFSYGDLKFGQTKAEVLQILSIDYLSEKINKKVDDLVPHLNAIITNVTRINKDLNNVYSQCNKAVQLAIDTKVYLQHNWTSQLKQVLLKSTIFSLALILIRLWIEGKIFKIQNQRESISSSNHEEEIKRKDVKNVVNWSALSLKQKFLVTSSTTFNLLAATNYIYNFKKTNDSIEIAKTKEISILLSLLKLLDHTISKILK